MACRLGAAQVGVEGTELLDLCLGNPIVFAQRQEFRLWQMAVLFLKFKQDLKKIHLGLVSALGIKWGSQKRYCAPRPIVEWS